MNDNWPARARRVYKMSSSTPVITLLINSIAHLYARIRVLICVYKHFVVFNIFIYALRDWFFFSSFDLFFTPNLRKCHSHTWNYQLIIQIIINDSQNMIFSKVWSVTSWKYMCYLNYVSWDPSLFAASFSNCSIEQTYKKTSRCIQHSV